MSCFYKDSLHYYPPNTMMVEFSSFVPLLQFHLYFLLVFVGNWYMAEHALVTRVCCSFRDFPLKMLQDWLLKAIWMFILYMLVLFPLLIQVSPLKEFCNFQKSGKLILCPRVLLDFLLGFSLPPITLQNVWQLEKLGCNLQLSNLQML